MWEMTWTDNSSAEQKIKPLSQKNSKLGKSTPAPATDSDTELYATRHINNYTFNLLPINKIDVWSQVIFFEVSK